MSDQKQIQKGLGKKWQVGIIGAGLIGKKRAMSLPLDQCALAAVSDLREERAQSLISAYQERAKDGEGAVPAVESDPHALMKRKDIDIIVIATANDALPTLASAALAQGKHVLIEKPGGRNPQDLSTILESEKKASGILRVGFNHRFHPGLQKAKKLMQEKGFGSLMYFRARYGHGGRLGYEKEWRADPRISGGGELLDQGVHLIDLCRWLGGEFDLEFGRVSTSFWQMPVEDNGFLLLKSPEKKSYAFLHASCSEWKNLFDFEIFGTLSKVQVFGLGRSYGVEEVRHYQMLPEMGPPELVTESFPGEDQSWNLEFDAFLKEIHGEKTDIGTAWDAARAVRIVYDAYTQSQMPWVGQGECKTQTDLGGKQPSLN